MAANNFNNWDNGFPYNGIEPATTNSMTYWDNGFPYQFVETTAGVAANTSGNFFFFFH